MMLKHTNIIKILHFLKCAVVKQDYDFTYFSLLYRLIYNVFNGFSDR